MLLPSESSGKGLMSLAVRFLSVESDPKAPMAKGWCTDESLGRQVGYCPTYS